ncbi:hypothetical protein BDV27DRAFT_139850 [Aspergillus caelatus]|uniref:Secreted protein n=2 Tax=Aspergillus subgen. Circumdati TaxID=2720871 RepID=A0A5N6ZIV6_9EURO|nr:uncharacterized protein BDV27DRAFT_139850 [Aspergillus caelatus]KAE8357163.1 hypothetical protein BDV27DRAFT_139850 [Aspergillus caelatus]KAE8411304.1 hypothetical protein BDV36DRAFT_275077 [Aspergillus pseudocaelatus]
MQRLPTPYSLLLLSLVLSFLPPSCPLSFLFVSTLGNGTKALHSPRGRTLPKIRPPSSNETRQCLRHSSFPI